jgi:hypothetical protein
MAIAAIAPINNLTNPAKCICQVGTAKNSTITPQSFSFLKTIIIESSSVLITGSHI